MSAIPPGTIGDRPRFFLVSAEITTSRRGSTHASLTSGASRHDRSRPERLRHPLFTPVEGVIYRQTKNLRAVQLLLGHTELESTLRCLGVEAVDDALEIAGHTEI
jgi:hypothetical protein